MLLSRQEASLMRCKQFICVEEKNQSERGAQRAGGRRRSEMRATMHQESRHRTTKPPRAMDTHCAHWRHSQTQTVSRVDVKTVPLKDEGHGRWTVRTDVTLPFNLPQHEQKLRDITVCFSKTGDSTTVMLNSDEHVRAFLLDRSRPY